MKIFLTKGHVAFVDDRDRALARHRWQAYENSHGTVYAQTKISGKTVRLHRAVMGAVPGDPLVDHIDGDGLNCRRSNLRFTNKTVNSRNMVGASSRSQSGHLGVHPEKGRWAARISIEGRRVRLGVFESIDDAVSARLDAEAKYWGIEPRRAAAHGGYK